MTSALMLAGCAAPPAPVDPATRPTAVATPTGPQDAKPTGRKLFQLQIFQLAVPEGAISRNADFWKPFDEAFLSPPWKHDVLYKNGLRVGRAPLSELAAMQNQLDNSEATRKELIGTKGQDVEMEVHRGIDKEIVFAFDERGQAEGRDYYSVDNLFMLSFTQVPRQPDHIFLSLAPAIRDQKQKLTLGDDGRPRWAAATSIYQVGISTQLGVDECLVIAPSDVAARTSTSVGRAFMIEERPASRVEKVLVIVPRLIGNIEEVKQPVPRSR
jgi:hypothetical protein